MSAARAGELPRGRYSFSFFDAASMRNMWVFFRGLSGRWHWQHRDGMGCVALESNDDFATVHDAEVDARLYGYGVLKNPGSGLRQAKAVAERACGHAVVHEAD